ncbi:hypothetical protein BDZ97DRAFT_1758744 [Flammula alnicola]|nr:hypothetical protein BDZ97DRAFT_1758744 [Flammula alnicola]
MDTVFETHILKIESGRMSGTPLPADLHERLSENRMLVHRARYVLRRLLHTINYEDESNVALYKGWKTPNPEDLKICYHGNKVQVFYEKADEVQMPILEECEIPFATILYFSQVIVPQNQRATSTQPFLTPKIYNHLAPASDPPSGNGSILLTTFGIELDAECWPPLRKLLPQPQAVPTQTISSRSNRPVKKLKRPSLATPLLRFAQLAREIDRPQYQTSPRSHVFGSTFGSNIPTSEGNGLKRKRDDRDSADDALLERVVKKPKRTRLLFFGMFGVGIGVDLLWNVVY